MTNTKRKQLYDDIGYILAWGFIGTEMGYFVLWVLGRQ